MVGLRGEALLGLMLVLLARVCARGRTDDMSIPATAPGVKTVSLAAEHVLTGGQLRGRRGDTPTLIISEVAEGSGYNKVVEFYNPTTATVSLDGYLVGQTYNNATEIERFVDFPSGVGIVAGGVYVLCHTNAHDDIAHYCNQLVSTLLHNGNDALFLLHGTRESHTVVDQFGAVDSSGTYWTICGTARAAVDHVLVRKPEVVSGQTDWPLGRGTNATDCEWQLYEQDTFTLGGFHESVLPAPSLIISEVAEGSGYNKVLEIYNPTAKTLCLDAFLVGQTFNNASTVERFIRFSPGASIAPGQVYVMCHRDAHDTISAYCDQKTPGLLHNGNDAIFLLRFTTPGRTTDNYEVIDQFGEVATSGTYWTVCGAEHAAVNHVLTRKRTVFRGQTDWGHGRGTTPADCEWDLHAENTFALGGYHDAVLPMPHAGKYAGPFHAVRQGLFIGSMPHGTAELTVSNNRHMEVMQTRIRLTVGADRNGVGHSFNAHLHSEPCSAGGGGHYQDPGDPGVSDATHENWLRITCDNRGDCDDNGGAENSWVPSSAALANGLSVIFHDTPGVFDFNNGTAGATYPAGARLLCADLVLIKAAVPGGDAPETPCGGALRASTEGPDDGHRVTGGEPDHDGGAVGAIAAVAVLVLSIGVAVLYRKPLVALARRLRGGPRGGMYSAIKMADLHDNDSDNGGDGDNSDSDVEVDEIPHELM